VFGTLKPGKLIYQGAPDVAFNIEAFELMALKVSPVSEHHALKTLMKCTIKTSVFITAPDVYEWSCTFRPPYPRVKNPAFYISTTYICTVSNCVLSIVISLCSSFAGMFLVQALVRTPCTGLKQANGFISGPSV
jgi:hypothetical protein